MESLVRRKAGISLLRKEAQTMLGTSAARRGLLRPTAIEERLETARGLADENDEGALSP